MKRNLKFLMILMCAAVLLVGSVVSVSAYDIDYGLMSFSVSGWTDEYGQFYSWSESGVRSQINSWDTSFVENNGGYSVVCLKNSLSYSFLLVPFGQYLYVDYSADSNILYRYSIRAKDPCIGIGAVLRDDRLIVSDEWVVSSSFDLSNYEICFAECPIYSDVDQSEIFFPEPEPPIVATAVAPVDLTKVLAEVLLIIPIGLACLVGYRALRKGLALLRQILYQA